MTTLKRFTAIAISVLGLAFQANAVPIVVNLSAPPTGDIAKNGTGIGGGNSNNAANNFFRLETFLDTNPSDFGIPLSAGASRLEGGGKNLNVNVTGFSFAVVHYGVGKGGIPGTGGGVEFFSISGEGSYSFPDNGSGLNGYGGFSSLDLFKGQQGVPDGGTTLALLGVSLAAIGVARRRFGV